MKTLRIFATALMCMGGLLSSFSCSRNSDNQQSKVSSAPRPVAPSLPVTAAPTLAQAASVSGKAEVKDAYGEVQQRAGAKAEWRSVNVGDLLAPATVVRTGKDAAVLLLLADRHVIRVGAESTLTLSELGRNKAFSFALAKGRFWSLVNSALKPTKYEVETPSAVVGVSGTVFSVFYQPQSRDTLVSTAEGLVTVRSGRRAVKVARGFGTRVAPSPRTALRAIPQDQPTQRMWQILRRQESWPQKSWPNTGEILRLKRQVQNNSELRRLPTRLEPLKQNARPDTPRPALPRIMQPARDKRRIPPIVRQPNRSTIRGDQPFKSWPRRKPSKAKPPAGKDVSRAWGGPQFSQVKGKRKLNDNPKQGNKKRKDQSRERDDHNAKPEKAKNEKTKHQTTRHERAWLRALQRPNRAGRFDIKNVLSAGLTGAKGRGRLRNFEGAFQGERRHKERKGDARNGRNERFGVGEFLREEHKGKGHKGRGKD